MSEFLILIDDIRFVGIDDFMKNKDYIKEKFNTFDLDTREIYKWYFFYELSLLKDGILRECCWDYLHDIDTYYKGKKITLEERYLEFCNKRNKLLGEIEGQIDIFML